MIDTKVKNKGLYVSQLKKDCCGIEVNSNDEKEFSFRLSILKGIEITSKGYDKEALV